ncbi:hypothetical protein ABB37_04895 [Leptomonas pyrrhocoris]|uniref:Uncharacterized protein n=1 Tax=Leptomonas pyrrhocoris TaxID=157538 RepID=A0A0M9G2B6_LEPPY|nr:hypothetical protein ABB37_04895 [Leptomonas pyrrhocoris]KPA80729.1 hypothetical protein ABB37_04895 [Leptomonas pyrrhocoris]|eukprot:XP_015659168.1 hypothetical protein ABB37_04895 [Leptomonas pyrrhocoris]
MPASPAGATTAAAEVLAQQFTELVAQSHKAGGAAQGKFQHSRNAPVRARKVGGGFPVQFSVNRKRHVLTLLSSL